jgi:phosphatidate cytidylyltransferase
LKTRVLTAAALIPLVLAALLIKEPWPITVLGFAITLIGSFEAGRMLGGGYSLGGPIGLAVLAIFIYAPINDPSGCALLCLEATIVGVGAAWLGDRVGRAMAVFASGLWIAGPIASILLLHQVGFRSGFDLWSSTVPELLAVVPLWIGDTAAIFAGRAFGKHLLAPKISPKKTVEGAIANLLGCTLAALALGASLGITKAIACGLAAGIFGQMGDLFESGLKRRMGLKDSGALLPGHGGVLDRIDSILLTAPVVALILMS